MYQHWNVIGGYVCVIVRTKFHLIKTHSSFIFLNGVCPLAKAVCDVEMIAK